MLFIHINNILIINYTIMITFHLLSNNIISFRVLAKVTCDVQLPKATRPNEGLLNLNVELSPMAALHYEAGPQSDLGVHLNRLLEKFLKESRCVDLESLCIVAEEKVNLQNTLYTTYSKV